MKAVQVKKFADPTAIQVQEVADLQPTADRVVVRVKAAGVNPADWYVVNGMFQIPPALPFTPGFEAAGEIIAAGTTHLQPGTRVLMTLPYLSEGAANFGAFAEQIAVPAKNVVPIPDSVDFAIAAALPVMYGTAYIALKHRAQLQVGDTLLVTGATGATGSAAVQIGKHLGATVIATASGAEKVQHAKDLGADCVIDYKQENVTERIKEFTQGKGVNVAFETVGGDLFEAAIQSMASEGRLLPIGMASGIIPELSMIRVLAGNFAIVGTDFAHYTVHHLDLVRQGLAEILSWHQDGIFKDLTVKTMPLEQAAEAIAQVHQGAGAKVVLTM
ncbi:NADPH:quinone oxidoreductase family protein [Scytonema sp. UIC 10036]|uniref:NADPH:quinone oxidoreductase family protein n=1 Tax=Scytonema sp. UIC 10036 TaxID=2304196 RepID=UPI00140F5745|nr:NADPH:quinone oxidoreductase family protein [Scytonema sp. UIC 10036]